MPLLLLTIRVDQEALLGNPLVCLEVEVGAGALGREGEGLFAAAELTTTGKEGELERNIVLCCVW